tara:strand:- start:83 stop:397 length:315 start_codon:yes stop_codon:yes gene_type:complete
MKKRDLTNKITITISSITIVIILALSIFNSSSGMSNITGSTVNEEQIKELILNHIETKPNLKITNIKEEHGLYKATITTDTESLTIYLTKDFELFFPNHINLNK